MKYSIKRFAASVSLATVVVSVLLVLILTSQMAMAIMPVVGVGGFLLQADNFRGNNALVYPEYGGTRNPSHGVTDTAGCKQRPMLVFELDDAEVNGYSVFKDIRLPFFQDRWMTIKLDQEQGKLSGQKLKIYTTQIKATQLTIDNILLREGESNQIWGRNSGEFIIKGDPGGNVFPYDLTAQGVTLWAHAVTGQQVTLSGGSGQLTLNLTFPTTAELHSRYRTRGIINANNVNREEYFDCLPARPDASGTLLAESFESGTIPAGWSTSGDRVVVNQLTSNSGSYSANINGTSTLTTPSFDLRGQVDVPLTWWIKEGSDTISNDPDIREYLEVQYRTKQGEWSTIYTYEGSDSGQQGQVHSDGVILPEGAYHSNFTVRFKTSQKAGSLDSWHIDDVILGG